MNRVFIVASLMSLGWFGTIVGQSNQTGSVLDRIVAAQPNGGPFVFAPPIKDWSDQSVLGVGSAADIVVGFEAAPEVEHLLGPMTDARKAQIDSRRRISLAGKTVREALDTVVAIDPRYRWVDIHRVPVVRPWASWVDPNHLLNKVVGAVEWPETNLTKALFDVATLMTGTVPMPAMTANRPPFFRVQTGPIAIMELLNTVALAHGHAYWQVRHRCAPNDPRALQVQLESYRHAGVGGGVDCRIVSHGR
jgi:hypothetical protein